MMKRALCAFILFLAASTMVYAEPAVPAVAIHIEKHTSWDCYDRLPAVGPDNLTTTYDGVGQIDAFVVFYNFEEAKGFAFGLDWPEAWGEGSWHDCGDLRMDTIEAPGGVTSVIWYECSGDSVPVIAGWLTLTVTSPGEIEVILSGKEGVIAILDCDPVAPALSEAMISLKAGAGGIKGDAPSMLAPTANRHWRVRPEEAGFATTIDSALRQALPGDTVLVTGGTYHESIILRRGVVVLGSWDLEFTTRSLSLTPSIIDGGWRDEEAEEDDHLDEEKDHHAEEHHSHGETHQTVVRATLGTDSSTVLDGFVITGGAAKQGGGITLRNQAKPVLSNLIIHSNKATYGGGIFCHASSPTISNCLIAGNDGDLGGGVYCTAGSSPVISNTTIAANHARTGAAVAAATGSSPTIERSIIAGHTAPSSIFTQDGASGIVISCCDLWQNETPQYGGGTEETTELRDNISVDPQFRDAAEMDFTPGPGSPVLSVPNCGRIGPEQARVPRK